MFLKIYTFQISTTPSRTYQVGFFTIVCCLNIISIFNWTATTHGVKHFHHLSSIPLAHGNFSKPQLLSLKNCYKTVMTSMMQYLPSKIHGKYNIYHLRSISNITFIPLNICVLSNHSGKTPYTTRVLWSPCFFPQSHNLLFIFLPW